MDLPISPGLVSSTKVLQKSASLCLGVCPTQNVERRPLISTGALPLRTTPATVHRVRGSSAGPHLAPPQHQASFYSLVLIGLFSPHTQSKNRGLISIGWQFLSGRKTRWMMHTIFLAAFSYGVLPRVLSPNVLAVGILNPIACILFLCPGVRNRVRLGMGKFPNIHRHLFQLLSFSRVRWSQMKFKAIFYRAGLSASLNLHLLVCQMGIIGMLIPSCQTCFKC